MSATAQQPWSEEEFCSSSVKKGAGYHFHHPFEVMLREGKLNREQVQGWVANRYYYQASSLKDGASPLQLSRPRGAPPVDYPHSGAGWYARQRGGNEAWIRLGEACGLTRAELENEVHVLPGVRFAVDAYVNFARTRPWQEAVCSSLTELFAPMPMSPVLRPFPSIIPGWPPRSRILQQPFDTGAPRCGPWPACDPGLFQNAAATGAGAGHSAIQLNVLWALLDAIYLVYVLGERQRV